MRLLVSLYFFVVAYTPCGLGEPVVGYVELPEPLLIKDVQRYVMETSKVLEELAKEHLWLLSRMIGTNDWDDLLEKGQPNLKKERVTGDSLERKESDDDPKDRGDVQHQKKGLIVKESPQPVKDQFMKEVEDRPQTLNEVLVNQEVDVLANDKMKIILQQSDKPKEKLHHPQNDDSSGKQNLKVKSLKTALNPKIGYTTDIGNENHPDPKLNYLALKDKPVQHHTDPYGKPIKESDKLQKGSEVSQLLDSVSPGVLNTQARHVEFSPISANKQAVQLLGKPIPSKTLTPVSAKTSESANPLTRLYNNHQVKPETNALPKGIYNPLALDYSYINDLVDDINNVVNNNMIAETNLHSTMNRFQPDKDLLDFPVQYYKPESLPNTHPRPYSHPAHHSRLQENDIGW